MHSGLKPFYYAFKIFLSIFVTLLRKKPESIPHTINNSHLKKGEQNAI